MLIYVHRITSRVQYTCDFIFEQYLGITPTLTADPAYFTNSIIPKLNYSSSSLPSRYTIGPVNLLFDNTIAEQQIFCFENDGYKAFFKTEGSHFPFDIFAAVFFLLSRYEEYLPYTKDKFGRYAHQNSLAFKEEFLQQPLVNIWLNKFAESLQHVYPELAINIQPFDFQPTYDIDIAWSFKNKGLLRDVGGLLKNPSVKRLQVLKGQGKDPYDCYDLLHRLHSNSLSKPIYFFLVACTPGRYDKNSDTSGNALKALIKDHAEKYTIGIHPSWKSNVETDLILREKKYLEEQVGHCITSSRQHYLKFNLPDTFNTLIKAGIKDDYSMGYGTINGYRASVASPFYWYDLEQERQTTLKLHPFCFMDATCFFQTKSSAEQAYAELLYYYSVSKEVNGKFITIFHNNILGGDGNFSEWPEMYERFFSVAAQDK